jgi:hypothetical protein
MYDLIKGQINGVSTGLNPVRSKWISPWSLRPTYCSKRSSGGLVLRYECADNWNLNDTHLLAGVQSPDKENFILALKKNLNNDVNTEGNANVGNYFYLFQMVICFFTLYNELRKRGIFEEKI